MTGLGDCLNVRCKVCKTYAYHDTHFGIVGEDYTCKRCLAVAEWKKEKGNNPFACCDERERLKRKVEDLEKIVMSFAENQR